MCNNCSNSNCSGCGPWLLPQGLTGATGAIGPQGPAGTPGAAGATGPANPVILFNSTTDIGTVVAGNQALTSYTLPANKLGVNGDAIEVQAWIDLPAFVALSSIQLQFDGVALVTWATGLFGTGHSFYFKALISRTSAILQRVIADRDIQDYMLNWNNNVIVDRMDMRLDTAVDLTAPKDIRVFCATLGVFAVNDVICRQMIVKHYKQ